MSNADVAKELDDLKKFVIAREASLQQYISDELKLIKKAIDRVANLSKEQNSVNPVQCTTLTASDVSPLLEERDTSVETPIIDVSTRPFITEQLATQPSHSPYKFFAWGGRIDRYVPEDFEFPRCSVKEMWYLWYFGDSSRGIHPFSRLSHESHHDDLRTKDEKSNLHRARVVMEALEDCAKEAGVLRGGETFANMSPEEGEGVYDAAYKKLLDGLYINGTHRPQTVRYATVAEKIYSKRRRDNPDQVRKRRRKSLPAIASESAEEV